DEPAGHHVHRDVAVLGEGPHGSAAQVRPVVLAAVGPESGVDDAQPPPAIEDRPSATPSKSWPVEFPLMNAMFRTTSSGLAWSWQCEVVHTCSGSQVSM